MRPTAPQVRNLAPPEWVSSADHLTRCLRRRRGSRRQVVEQSMLTTEWVAQCSAGRVYDRGWDERDMAGMNKNFPAGVMHMPVVRFTEQDAIS